MTGADHQTTAAIDEAGRWFADNRERCPKPIVPFLRERFGLTAVEACEALQVARRIERGQAA